MIFGFVTGFTVGFIAAYIVALLWSMRKPRGQGGDW